VEFISKHSTAADYGESAKPLIIVNEKGGKPSSVSDLCFFHLGKFYVENDTLVAINSEECQKALPDEDVNNKMFIVVRNLKTTASKSVLFLKVCINLFRTIA
jgi:hypothetical protein